MNTPKFHTAESVSCGHPDFVATAIADAILDGLLKADPNSHAGIEVLLTTNHVVLAGEITTTARNIPYDRIVRNTIRNIGYVVPSVLFSADDVVVENMIHSQSPDIYQGVIRENGAIGAGDQGIIFGYATNESNEYYPFDAQLANQLMRNYHKFQLQHLSEYYPDAKAQVTFDYANHQIHTILMAVSHSEELSEQEVRDQILMEVIRPTLEQIHFQDSKIVAKASDLYSQQTKILINTTGKFVVCGPHGDAGITNRKITVDQYGGHSRIGGGGLHGKDATKVDFSAAVGVRHAAKNLVAAGVADKIEIQVSYAIGLSSPLSVSVDTFGTSHVKMSDEVIADVLSKNYDFSPSALIDNLKLRSVNRLSTNLDYFFGVPYMDNCNHTWENLDKADFFKKLFFAE